MVYGRCVADRELRFEISGGLLYATLVLRDLETDSWWSILTGSAIAGPMDGARLEEIPVLTKTTWGEWKKLHPETKILSVNNEEHHERNTYDDYFARDTGFGGITTPDDRLPQKEPIFGLRAGGSAFAVSHEAIEGGKTFRTKEGHLFLYRRPGSSFFASTRAYLFPPPLTVERHDGDWLLTGPGTRFDPGRGFLPSEERYRSKGYDTFWYMWSLAYPDCRLLRSDMSTP